MRRAVFLDRDGTLNRAALPGEYVQAAYEVELLGGAAAAVAMLARAGYLCVVVSNQRGVALGHMTGEDLHAVDARLRDLVAAGGAGLDATYYCTHGLDDGCDMRTAAHPLDGTRAHPVTLRICNIDLRDCGRDGRLGGTRSLGAGRELSSIGPVRQLHARSRL